MANATPFRTGTDALIVVLAALVGATLVYLGGLPRWLGVALWIALWPYARGFAVVPRVWRMLGPHLPLLIVLATFFGLFWELVAGHPPASRDHGIHYFQTHILVDELLPSGRLWGWSDSLNGGYPFGESYPTLGYLLTGAAHLLSAGAVDLRTSYAWGILAVWGLGTVAVWWLAAQLAQSLGLGASGRWAAAVAALLWLLDPGASRQGGWNYVMFHGVWPQMLSAALWTLALAAYWSALKRPTVRRIAFAGMALGASVLAHPFGMLAAATSAGAWMIVALLWSRSGQQPRPHVRIWLIVHTLAALLSLWWLLAFFGSAGSMARSPVLWLSLGELSTQLLRGELFSTHWAWLGPLFVVGVFGLIRQRSPLGWLLMIVMGGLVILASDAAVTVLRLDLLVSGFKNLQFPRYTIEFKPVMFVIAGVGAVGIPAAVRSLLPRVTKVVRMRPPQWVFALTLAPFVTSLVEDTTRIATRPVGALDTLERSRHAETEAELLAALREEAATLPEHTPLRVAFLRHGMSGGTFPLFTITDAGAQLVLDGHIPAVNYKYRLTRSIAVYDALGVTHLIHDRPLPKRERVLEQRAQPLGSFGPYTLERYTPNPSLFARAYPPNAASLQAEHTAQHMSIRVGPHTGRARVALRRPPHLRWRATWNGEAIAAVEDHHRKGLLQQGYDVEGQGQLEIHYARGRFDRFVSWLGLTALLAAAFMLCSGRELGVGTWNVRQGMRRKFRIGLAVVVVLGGLAGVVLVHQRQQQKLAETWQGLAVVLIRPRLGPNDAVVPTDLVITDQVEVELTPARRCDGIMGKDVLAGCNELDHQPHISASYRKPYLYRCVAFTIPPGGTASVTLGAGGRDVLGFLTRTNPGRQLSLSYAGRSIGLGKSTRKGFFIASEDSKGAQLQLDNKGAKIEQVCIAAAEIALP